MLTIIVPGVEAYDAAKEKFVTVGDVVLELEHSLVSLSKWEQIFEKPFLSTEDKTTEESVAYVKAMALNEVPLDTFQKLTEGNYEDIKNHIERKMSATWFREIPRTRNQEIITAEIIYYWMTALQIPFECERWHLNRLFTLIRVCNEKQAKPKKMSKAEVAARNRDLNARRKAELGTRG